MQTKICSTCNVSKAVDQFYKKKLNKYGLQTDCKYCASEYRKQYMQANKVAVASRQSAYYQANQAELAKKAKIYQKINKAELAEKAKIYNQINKIAIAEKGKAYYQDNKVSIGEYQKDYNQSNNTKRAEQGKVYRQANKVTIAARLKAYQQANPLRYKANNANRRALKHNANGKHSAYDIKALFALQKGQCICCRASLEDGYHVDHIYSLINGGGNGKNDIQLLCPACNMSKGAKDPLVFMQSRGFLL